MKFAIFTCLTLVTILLPSSLTYGPPNSGVKKVSNNNNNCGPSSCGGNSDGNPTNSVYQQAPSYESGNYQQGPINQQHSSTFQQIPSNQQHTSTFQQTGTFQQTPSNQQHSSTFQQTPSNQQHTSTFQQTGTYQQTPSNQQHSSTFQQTPSHQQDTGTFQQISTIQQGGGAYQPTASNQEKADYSNNPFLSGQPVKQTVCAGNDCGKKEDYSSNPFLTGQVQASTRIVCQAGTACVSKQLCHNGRINSQSINQLKTQGTCDVSGGEICCRVNSDLVQVTQPGASHPDLIHVRPPPSSPQIIQSLQPTPTNRPYTGPLNTTPHPGCPAAMKCVSLEYCNWQGVMTDVPVILTREEQESRVPLTECQDLETGLIGKCCRDPNYKDPWPDMLPGGGCYDGTYCEVMETCDNQRMAQPKATCNLVRTGGVGVCCLNKGVPSNIIPNRPPVQSGNLASRPPVSNAYPNRPVIQNTFSTQGQQQLGGFSNKPVQPQNNYENNIFINRKEDIVPPQHTISIQQTSVSSNIPVAHVPKPVQSQNIPPQPFPKPVAPQYAPQQQQIHSVPKPQQIAPSYPQRPVQPQHTVTQHVTTIQSSHQQVAPQPIRPVPQPTAPQHIAPAPIQPVVPEYAQAAPQPVAPQHFVPEPIRPAPQPIAPQHVAPTPVQPTTQHIAPQPIQPIVSNLGQAPQHNAPQPARPFYPAPQPAQTEHFAPRPVGPLHRPEQTQHEGNIGQTVQVAEKPAHVSQFFQQQSPVNTIKYDVPLIPSQYPQLSSQINPGQICGVRRVNAGQQGQDGPSAPGEFPWLALISVPSNNTRLCAGALITDKAVLASAHCVMGVQSSSLQVEVGSYPPYQSNQEHQVVPVAGIARHPNFEPGTLSSDLAVLLLAHPVQLGKNVDTICVPEPSEIGGNGELLKQSGACVMSSWPKQGPEGQLNALSMVAVPRAKCEEALKQTYLGKYFQLHSSFMCAKPLNPQHNSCNVGLGGPLVCPNERGQYVLTGTSSWDVGCNERQAPNVLCQLDTIWMNEVLTRPIEDFKHDAQDRFDVTVDPSIAQQKPGFSQGYGRR